MIFRRPILTCLLLGITILLIACGGGAVEEVDTGGPPSGAEEEEEEPAPATTSMPTLAADTGIREVLFVGEMSSPEEGYTAIYIQEDDALNFVVVSLHTIDLSMWMNGDLQGQRVNATAEVGIGKVTGRFETDTGTIECNITVPGRGFIRTKLAKVEAGGLYKGELNGITAGLILLADGTVNGFAIVEDGDNPVFEFLCVDGDIEGVPDTITATTCDSGQEVTLTLVQ